MPQWVELPPNLVPSTQTNGKSIYATDYSSKRPGFQIHLQKAARGARSFHHPRVSKGPSGNSMRTMQTSNYMDFKEEYDKNLATKTSKTTAVPRPATSESEGSEVYREVLSKYVKPSLDLVRQAWKGETTAVKRDRDRMYGLSGKKVVLVPRPPKSEETIKTPRGRVLPGMKSWLTKSNEYEKAVVYNFMDHVAKASTKEVHSPVRLSTPQPKKSTFANEYFYKQRAKSAHVQRTTERIDIPPRPKTVNSFRNYVKESTEEGLELENEQPKEHEHEHEHGYHAQHSEGKCDFCDYQRVKKLLEYLNRNDLYLGEATLRHLLRPRVDPTHIYPSYEDFDYIHENSFFSNTAARDRGYFIIAPDWVSERKGLTIPKYRG